MPRPTASIAGKPAKCCPGATRFRFNGLHRRARHQQSKHRSVKMATRLQQRFAMVTRSLPVGAYASGLRARLRSLWTALGDNAFIHAARAANRSVRQRWNALRFTRRFYLQACKADLPAVTAEAHAPAQDITESLFQRSISPKLHSLVQLRVASQIACISETAARSHACQLHGWSDDQIRAALLGNVGQGFAAPEILALRYADEMTRTPIDVDPQTLRELRRHFSQAEVTELTASIAHENLRSRFTDANSRIR